MKALAVFEKQAIFGKTSIQLSHTYKQIIYNAVRYILKPLIGQPTLINLGPTSPGTSRWLRKLFHLRSTLVTKKQRRFT